MVPAAGGRAGARVAVAVAVAARVAVVAQVASAVWVAGGLHDLVLPRPLLREA